MGRSKAHPSLEFQLKLLASSLNLLIKICLLPFYFLTIPVKLSEPSKIGQKLKFKREIFNSTFKLRFAIEEKG
jgi:hypothetical protein